MLNLYGCSFKSPPLGLWILGFEILKIKWSDVMEEKMTNVSVLKNFNNIRNINSLITKRRLIFLGKIIRLPSLKFPSRLISAFCPNSRPLGRPNFMIRHC